MECRNHPSLAAAERCVGCAETFCERCLVEVLGQKYCASCKVMAIQGPPPAEDGTVPCEVAGKALAYSIIGIFCFGVILGPMAVVKALEAKREISQNPRLAGLAKANVALLLGATVFLLWLVGMISRASK